MLLAAASVTVTGCVTVSPAPGMKLGPAADPSRPTLSGVRQQPTRQTDSSTGSWSPSPSGASSTARPSPDRTGVSPAVGSAEQQPFPGRADPPAHHRAPHSARHPEHHSLPLPLRHPGIGRLCSLGQTYGRWVGDGEAARICRRTYGD